MQTRSYKDLFRLITSMIGTGGELAASGTEDTQVADFINRRFQQAFDTSQVWPRYLVTSEERRIIGLTIENAAGTGASDINGDYYILGNQKSGGSSHAKVGSTVYFKTTGSDDGSVIDSGAAIFEQQSGTNLWTINTGAAVGRSSDGSIDVTSAGTVRYTEDNTIDHTSAPYEVTVWGTSNSASGRPTVLQKQAIPYTETNRNNIGDFNRIHRKTPFINNSSVEYDFSVDIDGANILNIPNTEDSSAYVTYKREFTPFTVTSDFYNSTVEVPGEFFNFIAHAVYADFLRVQNRQQEAIAEEQVAQTYLNLELEKIDIRNNNNTVNKRFSTYVNRQSR
jgi:ribosomal protein L27